MFWILVPSPYTGEYKMAGEFETLQEAKEEYRYIANKGAGRPVVVAALDPSTIWNQ